METKQAIRKSIFQLRSQAEDAWLLHNSTCIFEQVKKLPVYQEASCIYAYMDFKKEVMTRAFIEAAWQDGKRVAVPKVHGRDMTYSILEDFAQLESGYFGIPEPAYGKVADDERALMIVPGVAFDIKKHRVGYGQGFYDKYLSEHREHTTIAVAFEFQLVAEAPYDAHDVLMDYLITEKQCIQ